MIAFLLLLQAGLPTVGDTIWLERAVRVPPGAQVRAPDWTPESPIELLGKPVVSVTGEIAVVRYPAVAWAPGTHTVVVPGPELLYPSGDVDSLPAEAETIRVGSILPRAPAESLSPQPPAGVVYRRVTTPLPLLALWGVAALIFLPVLWFWRRRGPVLAPAPRAVPARPPYERWAEAGEHRAVAAAAAAELRSAIAAREPDAHLGLDVEGCLDVIAARRPLWPVSDLSEVLRNLERARFTPVEVEESNGLAARARALAGQLSGGGAA